ARDQKAGKQERELVRRPRALAQVPRGEGARRSVRLEVQAPPEQSRVMPDAGGRALAPSIHRVEPESLQRREGDPLRHALGEPLLASALTAGDLDLRHVPALASDEAQPLA